VPETTVLQALTPWQIREKIQEIFLRDLLGPADGPDEEVSEATVRDRYLVGTLAARRTPVVPEESETDRLDRTSRRRNLTDDALVAGAQGVADTLDSADGDETPPDSETETNDSLFPSSDPCAKQTLTRRLWRGQSTTYRPVRRHPRQVRTSRQIRLRRRSPSCTAASAPTPGSTGRRVAIETERTDLIRQPTLICVWGHLAEQLILVRRNGQDGSDLGLFRRCQALP
jgi:hypothetical protein